MGRASKPVSKGETIATLVALEPAPNRTNKINWMCNCGAVTFASYSYLNERNKRNKLACHKCHEQHKEILSNKRYNNRRKRQREKYKANTERRDARVVKKEIAGSLVVPWVVPTFDRRQLFREPHNNGWSEDDPWFEYAIRCLEDS